MNESKSTTGRRPPCWRRWVEAAALAGLALLGASPHVRAEMVHDLGSIPGALRTPEAREVFGEQIGGVPPPEGPARICITVLRRAAPVRPPPLAAGSAS